MMEFSNALAVKVIRYPWVWVWGWGVFGSESSATDPDSFRHGKLLEIDDKLTPLING
jgi:hypothetical protein